MKKTTLLKWLYIFELTAPVFYRMKSRFIKDSEEKKLFIHFEESELPHSPEIKAFLREQYNMGVFPIPGFLIEWGAAISSFIIALFGKKVIYYFEYLFEKEAVQSYSNLVKNNPDDIPLQEFAGRLRDEEQVHLDYFMERLGMKKKESSS